MTARGPKSPLDAECRQASMLKLGTILRHCWTRRGRREFSLISRESGQLRALLAAAAEICARQPYHAQHASRLGMLTRAPGYRAVQLEDLLHVDVDELAFTDSDRADLELPRRQREIHNPYALLSALRYRVVCGRVGRDLR